MTYIKTYSIQKNGNCTRKILVMKCDYCNNIFEKGYLKAYQNNEFHFCNMKCVNLAQIKNGVLKQKKKNTFLKKYGVDHPLKVLEIKNKIIEKSPDSQNKKKQTTILKYGVEHTFASEEIKEKRRITMLKKYGVEHPCQLKEIMEKQHNTKKENGTYNKSKIEDKYYEFLCNLYGIDNVVRQITVHCNWSIDFYIKTNNTYIQFDGDYWHGLNRPIEEIKKFKTKQDVIIYKKWLTDREQETWFKENNLVLIRIKESSFIKKKDSNKFYRDFEKCKQ